MASTNNPFNIPSVPLTSSSAARIMALMMAQTGQLTDVSSGSIVRSLAMAIGSILNITGNEFQAQATQAIAYAGFAPWGITPLPAQAATGVVTFSTSPTTPYPNASTNILIQSGTLVSTAFGVQFATTEDAIILAGTGSITVPVQATLTGTVGNVAANTIININSAILNNVYVSNPNPISGGTNAEMLSATATRYSNVIAGSQLTSPQAIASAVIGVTNGSESVQYSTVYENFPTVGWTLYVDNGTGTASSQLLSNVTNFINDNPGHRPAGVPYAVDANVGIEANVIVSGTTLSTNANITALTQSVSTAVENYFNTLNFNDPAQLPFLSAFVSNAVPNALSSLTVTLEDSSGTSVDIIDATSTQRIYLNTLTVNITS